MEQGTQELHTERLYLRPLRVKDATMMFKNWAHDDRVTKYLSWESHQTIATTQKSLLKRENNYVNSDFFDWGIVVNDSEELIGTISVVGQNKQRKEMTIGYCIGYDWWGNGYVSEALKAVISYLFATTEIAAILATHDIQNKNSGKVMRKSGMSWRRNFQQAESGKIIAEYIVTRENNRIV